jgi:hypothetical protein
MLRRLNKRAQSTAEYAILIAIVVGAIVAMQVFVKRGLQGRVRDVVDEKGPETFAVGQENITNPLTGEQYEPYYVTSTATTKQGTSDNEQLKTGGGMQKTTSGSTAVDRNQTIGW